MFFVEKMGGGGNWPWQSLSHASNYLLPCGHVCDFSCWAHFNIFCINFYENLFFNMTKINQLG